MNIQFLNQKIINQKRIMQINLLNGENFDSNERNSSIKEVQARRIYKQLNFHKLKGLQKQSLSKKPRKLRERISVEKQLKGRSLKKQMQNFLINGNKIPFKQVPSNKNISTSKEPLNNYSPNNINLQIHFQNEDEKSSKIKQKKIQEGYQKSKYPLKNWKIQIGENKFEQSHLKIKTVIQKQRLESAKKCEEKSKILKDFRVVSQNLSQEEFKIIWENFITICQQLNRQIDESFYRDFSQLNEDRHYALLVEDQILEGVSIHQIFPSAIIFWDFDWESLNMQRIYIQNFFILHDDDMIECLEKFKEHIFSHYSSIQEIYHRLEHKKIEQNFVKPNQKLVYDLKSIGWKWKMILNSENKRFTIIGNYNKEFVKSTNQFTVNFLNLISYQQGLTMFYKGHQTLPLYEKISSNNEIQFSKENNLQMENHQKEVDMEKIKSIDINNDKEFQEKIELLDFPKYDRALKEVCFQLEKPCKLYTMQLKILLKTSVTRQQLVFNKQCKMTRLEYQMKDTRKPIFYVETLIPEIKLVIAKWENSLQNSIDQLMAESCQKWTNYDDKNEKGYVWIPNFDIGEDFHQINDSQEIKTYRKSYFSLQFEAFQDCIQSQISQTDYKIKNNFMIGICQVDFDSNNFIPILYFNVTRRNFNQQINQHKVFALILRKHFQLKHQLCILLVFFQCEMRKNKLVQKYLIIFLGILVKFFLNEPHIYIYFFTRYKNQYLFSKKFTKYFKSQLSYQLKNNTDCILQHNQQISTKEILQLLDTLLIPIEMNLVL